MGNNNNDNDFKKQIRKKGNDLGYSNIPETNESKLSEEENCIMEKIHENIQNSFTNKKEKLKDLENKETKLLKGIKKTNLQKISLEMYSEMDKLIEATKTDIIKKEEIKKEKNRAKRQYEDKFIDTDIDDINEGKLPLVRAITIIFVLFLVETVANSYFFGKNDDMGFVGGAMQAMIIAAVSVTLAYISGITFACIKGMGNEKNNIRIILSISWLILSFIAFSFGHTIIGWYRYALTYNDPEMAVTEAIPLFFDNYWKLYDLHCWMLIIIGLLFVTFAFHSGINSKKNYVLFIFSNKKKEYDDARSDLIYIRSNYLTGLIEIHATYLQKIEELNEKALNDCLELKQVYKFSKIIESEFLQIIEDEEDNLISLIDLFRNTNIKVRDTKAPTYFLEKPTINTKKYSLNSIEIIDKNKNFSSIDDYIESIEIQTNKAKQEIDEKFKEKKDNYEEIINTDLIIDT